jgi:hypothetical protein
MNEIQMLTKAKMSMHHAPYSGARHLTERSAPINLNLKSNENEIYG